MIAPTGLIDANNFYASAERAFDARLSGRPVVVLSNNDGCVVARSKEAKQIGIPMGAPLFEVRNRLENYNAVILSSNYELYADMSWRFQTLLEDFSPDVEQYSIDEVFVKMPLSRYCTLTETGRQIREAVQALTGIPVSVGFGRTKTLAKIAIELAKTSAKTGGVLDLTDSPFLDTALSRIAVGDVWGIGSRRAAMLNKRGIDTALQLRDADDRWVRQQMTISGLRTVHELRGVVCYPVEPTPKIKQQMCCSRSFGQETDDPNELRAAVAFFTARVAEKLREHGLVAGELTVFVTTDRFKDAPQYSNAATMRIAPKSDSTIELLPLALNRLAKIYQPGFPIRKAGVLLDKLELASNAPRRLWDAVQYELHRRLMSAVDAINDRWGRDSIRCGLYPSAAVWQTRAERRSPAYTTNWKDIMTAS